MPLVAFLPAIIGAAGGIGASLIGKSAAKSANQPQPLDPQQQQLIDIQKKLADYGIPAGEASFNKAGGAYDTSLDFYKNILSGSNEDILKLLNADQYTKSADESEANAYSLGGRSGSRAAVLSGVNESRAGAINRAVTGIRANAPGEIANIGQAIGNMGAQQLSAGAGGVSGASNILFGLAQLQQQSADRRAQLIGSIIGTAGTVAGAVIANRGN